MTGTELREWQARHKVTSVLLAELLEVTTATVASWRRRDKVPRMVEYSVKFFHLNQEKMLGKEPGK